ncbi:MAG: multiheme c-type cytochrome [Planctomycetota bacterium]
MAWRRVLWGGLWKTAALAGIFFVSAAVGSLCYFEFAPPESTCLSCHEIQASYDRWAMSTHRNVNCKACHGGSLTSGWHGLEENFQRLVGHFTESEHEDIRLSEAQVIAMNDKCSGCHQSEAAGWLIGGHAITYREMFLDEHHNSVEQLNDECLRCHGMFFEGKMQDLAEPLNIKGPWRLTQPEKADQPAIPCLACHQVHVEGTPLVAADAKGDANADTPQDDAAASDIGPDVGQGEQSSEVSASACFYVRAERRHFAATDLPKPTIRLGDKEVAVSDDPRQRVCVQCHAPNAFGLAGSSDDRTPRGVHEGLSCAACHEPHSNRTEASCANCHPQMSNCGLDVRTMDTTFHSTKSPHNIHFVSCADCHADGVPEADGASAKTHGEEMPGGDATEKPSVDARPAVNK